MTSFNFRKTLGSVKSFTTFFYHFLSKGLYSIQMKSRLFIWNFVSFLSYCKDSKVGYELLNLFGGFGENTNTNEHLLNEKEKSHSDKKSENKKSEKNDITKYPLFYLEEVRLKKEKYTKQDGRKENKQKEEIKGQDKGQDKGQEEGQEEGQDLEKGKALEKDLENLKTNFILEKTPMGNVIMYYNHERSSFEYYTDNIIPYRILDTVARKYVLTYDCCELYVDMDKEIKEYIINGGTGTKKKEEKGAGSEDEAQGKGSVEGNKESSELKETSEFNPVKSNPNVFAKFKSYNKDSSKISDVVGGGGGRASSNTKDTNSVVTSTSSSSKVPVEENTKILLKDKSNTYTCLGKFSNFSMLKKVDRAVVDKNYTMSFAEYKKMISSKSQ